MGSPFKKSMKHVTRVDLPRPEDYFTDMWLRQQGLDKRLPKLTGKQAQRCLQITRPLLHEVVEVEHQNEKYWKSWKRSAEEPVDHEVKMEIVDCFHFLLRLIQLYFKTPKEFYEYYVAKNEENKRRIENKY